MQGRCYGCTRSSRLKDAAGSTKATVYAPSSTKRSTIYILQHSTEEDRSIYHDYELNLQSLIFMGDIVWQLQKYSYTPTIIGGPSTFTENKAGGLSHHIIFN